jgi:phenylacetate-CoA ligase
MDMQLMLKLLYTLGQLRLHERWTRHQLETYQAESVRRLREYAYARSPFYQHFHNGMFNRVFDIIKTDHMA